MEAIVAARAWNEKYPPGTNVIVTKDDDSQFHTKTRSHAGVLGEHTVVVWVDGTTGCHDIERVRAAESTVESVKPETNIFGQKICIREECPAFFSMDDGDGGCDAKLDHLGRISLGEVPIKFGMVCKLPIEFEIVRRDEA